MIGWGVGDKVGCDFDGGCRGGWCASEGWGRLCEVIVVMMCWVVVCYWNYDFPRRTNKLKFFNQISTSI